MADPPKIRVLVVEDEPLGRDRILELLTEHPDAEVVGTAETGDEAVREIRAKQPDLIFLDVQMPRKTGLEVVREIGPSAMPATIFVTGFAHYALQAFESAAVDYLVKPFSDERFEEAYQRATHRIRLEGIEALREDLLILLQTRGGGPERGEAGGGRSYLRRLAVQMRGKLVVVPVEEIDNITASGVYAEVVAGRNRYLLRESLQTLEEQLDPREFMRIHRSEIVRLDRIEMLVRSGADHEVQLTTGARLRVGRSRREELERRLGRL